MIASTQGTVPVHLCFSSIDYRFGVCSTSSGLSAERTLGGAVTASGDNVLKARSKKKNFPSLGRLAKNLEIFKVSELRKVSCSAATAPSLERLQA